MSDNKDIDKLHDIMSYCIGYLPKTIDSKFLIQMIKKERRQSVSEALSAIKMILNVSRVRDMSVIKEQFNMGRILALTVCYLK